MSTPRISRHALWIGRPEGATRWPVLHAGPVSATLDGTDLRSIRVGDVELVQRVYVALRDAPWNTIPAETSDWVVAAGPDSFRVTFRARHRHEDIAFDWIGTISGFHDGVIRYEMDGICRGVFQYSKIGFNVHHALDGSVGRPYRAQTEAGELRGVLPRDIDPQRIANGTLTGMFDPYAELAIEVADGVEAIVALEGDLLELQDHRNWTDGNFKSYATPLALGFPFTSQDGQRIRQVLTVRFAGTPPPAVEHVPELRVGPSLGRWLPALGLGMPSHDGPLTEREVELLGALAPDHLRVDLALRGGAWEAAFDRAVEHARRLGTALELALSANETSGHELAGLAARLMAADVPVARGLVYPLADGVSAFVTTTPAAIVRFVRDELEPVTGPVAFAGGTNQNFSDINRDRPADPVLTGLCMSASPTVHAADDRSIVENLPGLAEMVRFAGEIGAPRTVHVSPVTIATRFGPYPGGPSAPGDLPAAVDVRQASLLGAAWTAGAIAALAVSGAGSATFFETTGWRGVLELAGGPPMPDRFPSVPGQVYPLYHVLADAADWKAGTLRSVALTEPLTVTGFAVEADGAIGALVVNLTPEPQAVRVSGLPGDVALVRTLDEASAMVALDDPGAFRAWPGAEMPVRDGTLWLELGAYAVARVIAGQGRAG
jgi:D-apionolactonase